MDSTDYIDDLDIQPSERLFLGSSIEIPDEFDTDEITENPETYASDRYDSWSVVERIGHVNFKEIYLLLINDIKEQPFQQQKSLCLKIIDALEEKYDYTFPQTVYLDDQHDLNELYKFLEFVEFDNVDFFSRVWKYLRINIIEHDVKTYCIENSDKVINEVDEQIELIDLSEPITNFLRTYEKERMIQFIIRSTNRNKSEIIIKIIEGE